jgi:hypothetical protein
MEDNMIGGIKRSNLRRLLLLAGLLLLGVLAASQTKAGFVTTETGTRSNTGQHQISQLAENEAGLIAIAGNVSTFAKARFICCDSLSVGGPQSFDPFWRAVPFTPAANASVTEVLVPVFYYGGTNEIVVSLNNDANGLPGTAIRTWHLKNLPTQITCCLLDVARDKTGIPVTGGTQYWVAVTTDSSDPDFYGQWPFNTTDMRSYQFAQSANGGAISKRSTGFDSESLS